MVTSCDFFPDDQFILTTNLEGDANIISLKDGMSIVRHETIGSDMKSNIAYCGHTVKGIPGEAGVFFIGSENKTA